MINYFELKSLPVVTQIYQVTRKTVWQVTDPYNILIVVVKGSCVFTINNNEYTVSAGSSIFIPHDVNYCRRPYNDEMCTFYYIHFSVDFQIAECGYDEAKSMIDKIRNKNAIAADNEFYHNNINCIFLTTCIKYSNFDRVEDLLKRMRSEKLKNHFESNMRISLYLCEILTYTTREVRKRLSDKNDINMSGAVNPKMKKALDYIRLNYANKISLDDICSHANVSPQHLIRCFKAEFAKTPVQFINEYRLNRAKEYFLNFPALTVKEVSNELGFEDQHYFTRLFCKMNNGETPTQFKFRVKNFKNTDDNSDV